MPIMRYHSIVVTEMPKDFEVVAVTTDDEIMATIQTFANYDFTPTQKVSGRLMGLR